MATWKRLELSTSSVTGWHSNQLNYQAAYGGNNRARTCDPLLVRQVLSQLSYAPIVLNRAHAPRAPATDIIILDSRRFVNSFLKNMSEKMQHSGAQ